MSRSRGRITSSPGASLATAAPDQRTVPSDASTNSRSGACATLVARASISPASALRAAACNALASEPPAEFSAAKREAVETADHVALDDHFATFLNFSFQCGVLSQPLHQHAGAAIHEALGEALMQGIGKLVLDGARFGLPMFRIGKPVRAVRHKRPGPHMRDPVRQRIDVAVGSVGLRDLAGEPVDRYFTLPHQESIEGHDQLGVHRRRDLAVIGNLADVPQPLDRIAV